jgi:Pectate lyase superfamily protein/MBG domain
MRLSKRRSFKPRFEALESRHMLSGSSLPFDDSGLAPAGLQAICALPNLPVFNVHSYGAVGNGVADDTVAIRSALSAAEANGGGIVYLPAGTYAVDPQASDPVAWGSIFNITSSNIVLIGDHDPLTGATETHLNGYVLGLKDPATNWQVTGIPGAAIGRFDMFQIFPQYLGANISNVQFRSLDINGQAPYTGNALVGGDPTTGDGWDLYHKAIMINSTGPTVDGVLVFNTTIRNWRGEEVYAGGNLIGSIDVINCDIKGTNASAVSCSAALLLAYTTIGGTNAGDDTYNGVEDYSFPTQSTTIEHCTITCSSNPANLHGFGVSFEGIVGGSSFVATNNTFANNFSGILFQDTAHNVLVDGNTFTNNRDGILTSIMNLYPGVTSGFSDFTISNNTFSSLDAGFYPQNYGTDATSNFPNLVLNNNTVAAGALLDGGFGGVLGSWTGFLVENTTIEGGIDINRYSQGDNMGLWTGTIRPAAGTNAFYASAPLSYDYSGGSTTTIRIMSDITVVGDNWTSGPLAATIDPSILAGFPVGFTTTVYGWGKTNWVLKADPTWNTFSSDLPIGPNGLTIEVNSNGLFTQVTQAVPTVEITGCQFDYDGLPHTATAISVGADGVTPVAGSFSITYNGLTAPPTAPGSYAITATFTSTDPHYCNTALGGTLNIVPTTPTVIISGSSLSADAAVAAAVSVDGVTPIAGNFSLTYDGSSATPTTPGTYAVSASFNSGDPDYASTTTSGNLVIGGYETAQSVTVTVGSAGTFMDDGSIVATNSLTLITNNSISAQGVLVSGTNQVVGGIDGAGSLVVSPGGDLTANFIRQGSLVINGSARAPGLVTLAPSDSSGNPLIKTLASTNSSQAAVAAAAVSDNMVPMADSTTSTFARRRIAPAPVPSATRAAASINTAVVGSTLFPPNAVGIPRFNAFVARSSNGPLLVAWIVPSCLSQSVSTSPVNLQHPPVLVTSMDKTGTPAPRTSIRAASVPNAVAIANDIGRSLASGIASTRLATDAVFEEIASTEDDSLFNLIATGDRRSALLQRSILSLLRLPFPGNR